MFHRVGGKHAADPEMPSSLSLPRQMEALGRVELGGRTTRGLSDANGRDAAPSATSSPRIGRAVTRCAFVASWQSSAATGSDTPTNETPGPPMHCAHRAPRRRQAPLQRVAAPNTEWLKKDVASTFRTFSRRTSVC